MPDSNQNIFNIEKEKSALQIKGAFGDRYVIACLLLLLGFFLYGLYALPSVFQGSAKLVFKNEAQAKNQLELISSNILFERLAVKLNTQTWADADSLALNNTPFDKVLSSLGLKRDFDLLSKKQKIAELLKSGVGYDVMANAPVIKISFVSEMPNLAVQVPNLIAKEYLQMVKAADFIKVRQIQSANRATLQNHHISYGFAAVMVLIAMSAGVLLTISGAIKARLKLRKRQKAASVEMPKVSAMLAHVRSDDFYQAQNCEPQMHLPRAA